MSEIAWAAGLFEGEGSIIAPVGPRWSGLSIGSTDRDVLERFSRAVEAGRVYGPYKGQGTKTPAHYRPMYNWRAQNIFDAQRILRLFWPYLGERRKAAAAKLIACYYESDRPRLPQRRNHRALTGRA